MEPLFRTVILLVAICFTTQGITMTKDDTTLPIDVINHCIGRYQIDLPADLKMVKSLYGNSAISLTTYAPDDQESMGVLRGKQRIEQWQAYVEADRKKHINSDTQYIIQELEPTLKTIVYYQDNRKRDNNPNKKHIFRSFFFKDVPQKELGIIINDTGGVFIPRDESQYISVYKNELAEMKKYAARVTYQPWPHNYPGVCLDREISVIYDKAIDEESYLIKFFNGKQSRIAFTSDVFDGSEAELKQKMSDDTGRLSQFASMKVVIAGREGRLFVSHDRYSESARQFRWISIDDKINSTSHARLEIEGNFDIADYPELKSLNSADMIVAILKGIKVRDNGMVY